MEKKKGSTVTKSKPKKVIEKVVEKVRPKLVKKKYTLINNISVNGSVYKKGSTFELTKEGKQYFKQQFYI